MAENAKAKRRVAVTTTYPLRIDQDLLGRFEKLAEANHRTMAQHLRWLMSQEVDRFEKRGVS
jgi:hypothetical protein